VAGGQALLQRRIFGETGTRKEERQEQPELVAG
jgi:hypothetical protein